MIVFGIDPGLKGAIAVYRPEDHAIRIFDMPTYMMNEREHVSPVPIARLFEKYLPVTDSRYLPEAMAIVEDVSAMTYTDATGQKRGQGAAASFAFGKGFGVLLGVLGALRVRSVLVKAAVWKSLMKLDSDKNKSRLLAMELFPEKKAMFARKMDDGRAEAALLALFGAERFL